MSRQIKNKLKVVFVNLPTQRFSTVTDSLKEKNADFPQSINVSTPLGILHLASVVEAKDYIERIDCLDYALELLNGSKYGNLENFIDLVAEKITYSPDVLAFSVIFSTSHHFFITCAKRLKRKWPNVNIIIGGEHATNATKELFDLAPVDYIIRGEGEISFPEVLYYMHNNLQSKTASIKGVYSKKTINTEEVLNISELPQDLDKLPFPAYHILDMDRYKSNSTLRGGRGIVEEDENALIGIMTLRGCPYRCTYCSANTVHSRSVRYFSIDYVIALIKKLYKEYSITTFAAEDDNFNLNKKRVIELLNEIQELQIPNFELRVPNALSVNSLDEAVIDALVSTGLKIVNLAVESGSKQVNHNIMKKGVRLDKCFDLIKMFRERGIVTRVYFIHGFPGESKEMIVKSINFAKELGADWCTFSAVKPLLGTPLYDEMVANKYIDDSPEYWSEAAYGLREFDTKEITANELNDLLYEANIEINFLNNYNINARNYEKALVSFKDIVLDYPFHVVGHYMLYVCYKEQGDYSQAHKQLDTIKNIINSSDKANNMYQKYKDRMIGIKGFKSILISEGEEFRNLMST